MPTITTKDSVGIFYRTGVRSAACLATINADLLAFIKG